MKPAPSPARSRRALWIVAGLLAFYTLAGFLLLPPIVKSQIEKRATAATGRAVTIGRLRLNPFALSVTVDGLDVAEKGGAGSFLGWNRLHIRAGLLASLGGDWVLREVDLDGFHARAVVNPDGTLNFSDLLAKAGGTAGPPSPPTRPLRVDQLRVTGARLDFTDHSRPKPFQTTVGPLHFDLSQFRTAGQRGAPYHFEATTETGERFRWSGTLTAIPFRSKGDFAIENLDLPKYAPYYEQAMRADIAAGKLSAQGRYEIALDAPGRVLQLLDGGVRLSGLRVTERSNGQPAFELASLDVSGVDGDATTGKVHVGRIALAGGRLSVRRDRDGTLNLLGLLPPAAPAAAGPPPAARPFPTPEVTIAELALSDFGVEVDDLAAPRPSRLALSAVQFSAKGIAPASSSPMSLHLSLQWAPRGSVALEGTARFQPELAADLKATVSDLALLPLSPYLETFAQVRLTQGAVSTQSRIQLALKGASPAVTLSGDVLLQKFGLVDGVNSEELAGASSVALTGLKIATAPRLSISLAELAVAGPYARVLVGKDGRLNLAEILPPPAAAVAAPPSAGAPSPAAPLPQIDVGKVTVTGGDFSFTDRSIQPQVAIALSQCEGRIEGLSSGNRGRADVNLKAAVNGVGPVSIVGKLDALTPNPFVDLKIAGKSVDLLALSPYSGKYAGYEIARGNLFVDVDVKVADRKIDMANVVTLNQFTFGDPVKSADATKLPVRLGVALLKDINGQIVIDLPVQGDLGDPNFRVGRVVVRVIVNLLTKAALSPFSLLGSVFGGGGEELSFQEFAPGSFALEEKEHGKLATLVKALTNRPALNLDIEGSYDAAADTYALQQQKLQDLLRRRIWEERRATDPNIPPPEQLTISDAERLAMLKRLFDAKFPPGSDLGTPLPKPPAIIPPPPPPPPGLFKRISNFVTFEDARRKRAEQKEQVQAAADFQHATAAAIAAGLPPEEMTARLADTMEVTPNDLLALAAERAQQVRDDLVNAGKIPAERLFLAKSNSGAETAKAGKGPRVFFQLR